MKKMIMWIATAAIIAGMIAPGTAAAMDTRNGLDWNLVQMYVSEYHPPKTSIWTINNESTARMVSRLDVVTVSPAGDSLKIYENGIHSATVNNGCIYVTDEYYINAIEKTMKGRWEK